MLGKDYPVARNKLFGGNLEENSDAVAKFLKNLVKDLKVRFLKLRMVLRKLKWNSKSQNCQMI